MMGQPGDALIASWSANADLWTRAVRERRIASRREATDAAILAAVRRVAPSKLLDVGCGEGWLCRALADTGAQIVGVDASPELIAAAREAGGATFVCLDYAGIAARPEQLGVGFDTLICNFSLLDEKVDELLEALARIAASAARLLIQTVHPTSVEASEDGWRTEDFSAFGEDSWAAMPWYFRTCDSWRTSVAESWRMASCEAPSAASSGRPASLLITAHRR